MKKSLLLIIAVLVLIVFNNNSAEAVGPGLRGEAHLLAAMPSGDIGDLYTFGYGLGASVEMSLLPSLYGFVCMEYLKWGIKDEYANASRFDEATTTSNIIPIKIGAKWYLMELGIQPYIGFEIGLYMNKLQINTGNTVYSIDESDIGVAPIVGIMFPLTEKLLFNGSINYTTIFSAGTFIYKNTIPNKKTGTMNYIEINAGVCLPFN